MCHDVNSMANRTILKPRKFSKEIMVEGSHMCVIDLYIMD